jgi:hypothetical protein
MPDLEERTHRRDAEYAEVFYFQTLPLRLGGELSETFVCFVISVVSQSIEVLNGI